MRDFFRFFGSHFGRGVSGALRDSFSAAWGALSFLSARSVSEEELFQRRGCVTVLKLILCDAAGVLIPRKLSLFRKLLEGELSPREVDQHIAELKSLDTLSCEEAVMAIESLSDNNRERLLRLIMMLIAADTEIMPESVEAVRKIFTGTKKMTGEEFDTLLNATVENENRRRYIIGSGAGVLVALVVIVVFILTATLLRSVIFGLILAYILLPLEKYFERHQRQKKGVAYYLFYIIGLPLLPLRKLSSVISSRIDSGTPEEEQKKKDRVIITQAVAQTVLTSIILIVGLFIIFHGAVHYFNSRESKIVKVAGHGVRAGQPKGSTEQMIDSVKGRLDALRSRVERMPVMKYAVDHVSLVLKDEKSQRELLGILLKSSGGIFHFTVNIIGTIGAIACDLLLTVFFALLFLTKLAEFCRTDESKGRQSEYLVRSVFNGNWLPYTTDAAIGEAKRIIGGIMTRLRIWVRGYLTLVFIDATVYTTVFFFLKVPYYPLLGLLAGCGILLPYLGPVLSASLTVLITLAYGGSSGVQLAAIVCAYLVYNGIIEQFILYPAVIGDSLGLTTLETIVVVLLGAVLAGIPGMLFALPAASVLKYIVPQIHNHLLKRNGVGE